MKTIFIKTIKVLVLLKLLMYKKTANDVAMDTMCQPILEKLSDSLEMFDVGLLKFTRIWVCSTCPSFTIPSQYLNK